MSPRFTAESGENAESLASTPQAELAPGDDDDADVGTSSSSSSASSGSRATEATGRSPMVLRRSSPAFGGGSSDESALTHSATSLSGDTYSVRHPGDVMTRHRAGLPPIRLSVSVTTVLPRVTGTAPVGLDLSEIDAWAVVWRRRGECGAGSHKHTRQCTASERARVAVCGRAAPMAQRPLTVTTARAQRCAATMSCSRHGKMVVWRGGEHGAGKTSVGSQPSGCIRRPAVQSTCSV